MSMARRSAGRPSVISQHDIVRAGCEIGMERLTVKSTADALGVSAGALYRHLEGRWELERLVGEQLLSALHITDHPDHETDAHLVSFAVELRRFVAAHPGLAAYMLVLFPRGANGARLLKDEVAALARRGYSTETAVTLIGAVARLTVSWVAAEERRRNANADASFLSEAEIAHQALGELGPAYEQRWLLSDEEYFELLISAVVSGLVSAAPSGKPLRDIVAELRNKRDTR